MKRRTFLRGAGAAIALPFLEAMLPRAGRRQALAGGGVPTRMLAYYVPNGIHMASWTPEQTGSDFTLPHILEPLAPIRDKVLVLSNLANRNAIDSVPGDHARGTGAFLTARLPVRAEGEGIYNGVSVDQYAAGQLGTSTRFASLQLGMEGGTSIGSCDSGYSCAYSRNISWADATTPLSKSTGPRVIFDRLFGGMDTPDPDLAAHRRTMQASILDAVREDAHGLQARLGQGDRARLDQYLTGIRELERRIDAAPVDASCGAPLIDENWLVDFEVYSRVMNDLMVTALQCDQTRIITFMLGNGASYRNYGFIGATGAHHELSHHQRRPAALQALEAIGHWEVTQLAHLLQSMDDVIEADGQTLLDHSMVFFSSEISDGDRHNHDDLPVLLAGGGGGAFRSGRHIRYTEEQPVARLFVSMLQAMGLQSATFGTDGDGPLDGLS